MNCKQKFLCSLVFGLLLIAGAAFADTILPEVYTFDGNPIQGEHVDGEILVMLELPSSISSATGEAFEAGLISSSQSLASRNPSARELCRPMAQSPPRPAGTSFT